MYFTDHIRPLIHIYKRTILCGPKSYKNCVVRDANLSILPSELGNKNIFIVENFGGKILNNSCHPKKLVSRFAQILKIFSSHSPTVE